MKHIISAFRRQTFIVYLFLMSLFFYQAAYSKDKSSNKKSDKVININKDRKATKVNGTNNDPKLEIALVNIGQVLKSSAKVNNNEFNLQLVSEKEFKDNPYYATHPLPDAENVDVWTQPDAFTVGGRLNVVVGADGVTKNVIETGYFKGSGVEVSLDSDGNVSASFEKVVEGEKVKISIKGNANGEFSNAEYSYSDGTTTVKISGDAQDKISVEGGYTYSKSPENGNWAAGIGFTVNGDNLPVLKLSNNFNYTEPSNVDDGKIVFAAQTSVSIDFEHIEDSIIYLGFSLDY